MKTTLGLGLCLLLIKTNAQDPVSLSYKAKKLADKQYEIVISAKLEDGWHLYSQTQPESAVAIPTEIRFNKNPLIVLTGKLQEKGQMEKYTDRTLGIEAWQYAEKVEFTQIASLKTNVKTNLAGTITYQLCNDERCLPPKTVSFSIAIQ